MVYDSVCLLYIPYFQTSCPMCTWAHARAFLCKFFHKKKLKDTFFPIFSIKDQVFKVELLWDPTTKSAQFFFHGSVCVYSIFHILRPHAPRRGIYSTRDSLSFPLPFARARMARDDFLRYICGPDGPVAIFLGKIIMLSLFWL